MIFGTRRIAIVTAVGCVLVLGPQLRPASAAELATSRPSAWWARPAPRRVRRALTRTLFTIAAVAAVGPWTAHKVQRAHANAQPVPINVLEAHLAAAGGVCGESALTLRARSGTLTAAKPFTIRPRGCPDALHDLFNALINPATGAVRNDIKVTMPAGRGFGAPFDLSGRNPAVADPCAAEIRVVRTGE